MQYLEGIATLRFSFTVVAELIYYQFQDGKYEDYKYSNECQLLLNAAKSFCTYFTDESGPGMFLAKQLARQYGITFLKKLMNDPNMQWIVPKTLNQANEVRYKL